MTALSEKDFQQRVIDYAKLMGWMVHHTRPAFVRADKSGRQKWVTPLQGHKGFLDLVLARRGVVIFAELKREDGRLSPEQKRWLEQLGANAHVWRPSDWDEIKVILR